jgi:large subunit ribosomal protein L10
MRAEKKNLVQEYLARLNGSPFFVAVDYRGLNVRQFGELRNRLRRSGAELHVVKNTVFALAAQQAGLEGLGERLLGQVAVVTGSRDLSAAAKVLKSFQAEFDKPKLMFGCLGNRRLEKADLAMVADLPPLEVLRAQLLGLLQAPATRLARLLQTPATRLARVLAARVERETPVESLPPGGAVG